MRPKRGDTRNGLVYWGHDRSKGGEIWLTPEKFASKKEQQLESNRKWEKKNYERMREVRTEWAREDRRKNPEKVRTREKRWRDANPEKARKPILQWEKRNPEKVKESAKRWALKNPDKLRAYKHIRRARERNTSSRISAKDIARIREKARGKCFYCGKKRKLTIDHIVPLAKGGDNSPDNLVMACKPCNCKKGAKDPVDFAQSIGLLLV